MPPSVTRHQTTSFNTRAKFTICCLVRRDHRRSRTPFAYTALVQGPMLREPHMGRTVDVQNARTRARGDYAQALAKIEADGLCPFCEAHLPKHHTKPILFGNAHWI